MQIAGKLREDINRGNAVLVLGAGVGMAAGLFGGEALALYLYEKAAIPALEPKAKNLARLVSAIDKDPQFTRSWVDERLIEYFTDRSKYTGLEIVKRLLLAAEWKAIFTTNFDLSLELAYAQCSTLPGGRRLVAISDPGETDLISSSSPQRLKYFKFHGCVDALEKNPRLRIPLVLTQKDFTNSIARNAPFWKELRDSAYGASVIFLGFNVQRTENTHILGSVQGMYETAVQSMHDTFKPFAVLPLISEEDREQLEELDINLLDGTADDFLSSVEYNGGLDVTTPLRIREETIEYHYWDGISKFSRSELEEFNLQFSFFYKGFFESHRSDFEALTDAERSDAWKSRPSLTFAFSGRPVRRNNFQDAYVTLVAEAKKVARTGSSRILFVEGERAAGKTIMAHALAEVYFLETKNHVLLLNHDASVVEARADGSEGNFSGWNGRLINKFLSQGVRTGEAGEEAHISLLVADHCAHKQVALDNLIRLLGNHGKKTLLLLTINPEEFDSSTGSTDTIGDLRLAQFHPFAKLTIPHALENNEIEAIFSRVAEDCPRIRLEKERLLFLAKSEDQAARDLLLTLYLWFDKDYRRLDEIIAEEAAKLEAKPKLLQLYLTVAVFHQYNLSPAINLCLRACDIGISGLDELRDDPFFRAFIRLSDPRPDRTEDSFTRHPDFTRKILKVLAPTKDSQLNIMFRVMKACEQRDLQFVRAFFDYVYQFGLDFALADVTRLKEATEHQRIYERDVVLNHRFAAYLIRENANLDQARYYLDLADQESPVRNAAITHSLGALNYAKFRSLLGSERDVALKHYSEAKDYFKASRRAKIVPDEYGYVTDSDMTRYLLESTPSSHPQMRAELEGENQSLIFEAMHMVPKQDQNYIAKRLQFLRPFKELALETRLVLERQIQEGQASATLIRYYADSYFNKKEPKNWRKLGQLVKVYENSGDIHTQIQVGIISKYAFLRSATSRFERLRRLYDKLIKFQDADVGFAALSEYIRLVQVDAFVLEKFDLLRTMISDVREVYRFAFPRFLEDEYVLQPQFYNFDDDDEALLKSYFIEHSSDFRTFSSLSARRFTRQVEVPDHHELYFTVQIDPVSRLYIRGVRKELATDKRRIELSFSVKHAFDGLKVTDLFV